MGVLAEPTLINLVFFHATKTVQILLLFSQSERPQTQAME